MITLFVNKEEHIFDIQFKLPFVNDKLDKKAVDDQNILTLNGGNIQL